MERSVSSCYRDTITRKLARAELKNALEGLDLAILDNLYCSFRDRDYTHSRQTYIHSILDALLPADQTFTHQKGE